VRRRLRDALFRLLGKEPEAVVAVLDPELEGEMRRLVPDRRLVPLHRAAGEATGEAWLRLTRALAPYRVALIAVRTGSPMLGAALLHSPRKVLAFHEDLERHHLRWYQPWASWLFLRGLPKDRIFLRPKWLYPFKRDRSELPARWDEKPARGWREGFPRVAIVSPYLPWPLSHGGAVRMWNLLREAAAEFDICLFGFEDGQSAADLERIGEWCAALRVAAKPRWREPRWSTIAPPEVGEFWNPSLDRELHQFLAANSVPLLQAEYTQMAAYRPEVLVEHDLTWDLFEQIHAREGTLSSAWNLYRWRRFESKALRAARRVVVMSEKDAGLAGVPGPVVIPNGVDLDRYRPEPERPGRRLLFIGSFRHWPNVRAWRFLIEEVWPLAAAGDSDLRLTVVAGPDPHLYWPQGSPDPRVELRGFVADVRPLYAEANLVLVPTLVSAGTNLKALEAMATGRALLSTSCGVAGLGLEHGKSVWIAEEAREFALGIRRLLDDAGLRQALAAEAHALAVKRYGWPAITRRQAELWREELSRGS
jgi:glycosyltransferase involved in cell wall biosynthesis